MAQDVSSEAAQQAAVKQLAKSSLKLRTQGILEWRETVVGNMRMEFFRGKDFLTCVEQHPKEIDEILEGTDGLEKLRSEEKAALLSTRLLKYGLIARAGRIEADKAVKQSKSGQKGLVKWPKKLVMMPPHEQKWDAKSFYIWTTKRPLSMWTYIGSALLVIFVAAVCMFPLAPLKVKWVVLYVLFGMLGLMLAIILVRAVLYMVIWTMTGRHVWLFPMLFEDVSVKDSFATLIGESKDEEGKTHLPSPIWVRLIIVSLSAAAVYSTRHLAPDKQTISSRARRANRSVLEFLDMLQMNEKEKLGPGESTPCPAGTEGTCEAGPSGANEVTPSSSSAEGTGDSLPVEDDTDFNEE
mmetsp:Transcript_2832/g.8649  ORF Transcript_2832/g.8649 Transcript_2832/m.8649 type:complete len:353 (+) Transcript_2832:61-1119(+)